MSDHAMDIGADVAGATTLPPEDRGINAASPPEMASLLPQSGAAHLAALLRAHGGALRPARLRWIGAGGTHFVYAHPDQKGGGYVLKIKRDPALDDPTDPARAADDAAVSLAMLRRYFPSDWLPDSHVARVPVVMPDGAWRAAATVRVQRYDPNFLNGERVTLQNQYLELFSTSAANVRRYQAVATLLTGRVTDASLRAFMAFNPGLKPIAVLAASDAGFREMVATLVRGATHLAGETGNIVDFVGHDNVFFYRTAQGWSCRLGDIAKGNRLDRLTSLLRRAGPIAGLQDVELCEILNGLAFVRAVNFLAVLVDGAAAVALPLLPRDLHGLRDSYSTGLWLQRLGGHLQALDLGDAGEQPRR